jgi:hypothetical protein
MSLKANVSSTKAIFTTNKSLGQRKKRFGRISFFFAFDTMPMILRELSLSEVVLDSVTRLAVKDS